MEQFYEENFGEFATEKDAVELYQMLYQIFDFRVSRLPSMEELLQLIRKNGFYYTGRREKLLLF